jgi:hypothetical protein
MRGFALIYCNSTFFFTQSSILLVVACSFLKATAGSTSFMHVYFNCLSIRCSIGCIYLCDKHNRSLKVAVQGPDFMAPTSYIHSYTILCLFHYFVLLIKGEDRTNRTLKKQQQQRYFLSLRDQTGYGPRQPYLKDSERCFGDQDSRILTID